MKRPNAYLNDKQLETIKNKLLGEKERITNKEEENGSPLRAANWHVDRSELSDPVDEATASQQVAQELRFKSRENFYLKKINQTLQKIKDGTYGLCKECDAEIGFDRLMARTTADLCITCKELAEQGEKSNYLLNRSKSLGQTLQERVAR